MINKFIKTNKLLVLLESTKKGLFKTLLEKQF